MSKIIAVANTINALKEIVGVNRSMFVLADGLYLGLSLESGKCVVGTYNRIGSRYTIRDTDKQTTYDSFSEAYKVYQSRLLSKG